MGGDKGGGGSLAAKFCTRRKIVIYGRRGDSKIFREDLVLFHEEDKMATKANLL